MNNKMDFNIITENTNENGKNYKVQLKVPLNYGFVDKINLVCGNKSFPIKFIDKDDDFAYFNGEFFLETQAVYHYYFSIVLNGNQLYLDKNSNLTNDIKLENMPKLSVNFEVPSWAKGKIMYHIFVDRFNKGNENNLKKMPRRTVYENWNDEMKVGPNEEGIWNVDFYGGDLKGIEDKLNYLKTLGGSIIYLSPVCYSQSNHRYDTSDYEVVDPYLGKNADLKSLCDKAHELGMKIILDFVFNHTGNDSKYFNEFGTFDTIGAFQSKESPYYDFYRVNNRDGKETFNYWWGFKNEVVCDGNSKKWQDYIYGEDGIIAKYFDLGIDGIRYDVADELTDDFIEKCCKRGKEKKKDAYFLGEVWENPMRMNRGYISSGKGMHSVMNYLLMDALIRYYKYTDVYKLKDILNQIITEYPEDTVLSLMNFTSTHDMTRLVNLFATNEFNQNNKWAWDINNNDVYWQHNYKISKEDYEKAKKILKSYVFALSFLPGNLSIFYGDEVGICGMGNLSNRKPFPWNNMDKDLLEFYRKIGQIRNLEKFLEEAGLTVVDITNDYFMFERVGKEKEALVVVNRTENEYPVSIPDKYKNIDTFYEVNNSSLNKLNSYGGVARIRK